MANAAVELLQGAVGAPARAFVRKVTRSWQFLRRALENDWKVLYCQKCCPDSLVDVIPQCQDWRTSDGRSSRKSTAVK
jgi:hypothetical protein